MAEYLVVAAPGEQPRPAPSADVTSAVLARWPSAIFPPPPPSVALTVWVPDAGLVVDVHPSGTALTVDASAGPDAPAGAGPSAVARWWADVIGAEVWLTDVSGLGYSTFWPGRS